MGTDTVGGVVVDWYRVTIKPEEIRPGDVYQRRRIVYVNTEKVSKVTYVDFEDGSTACFSTSGLIEVMRLKG